MEPLWAALEAVGVPLSVEGVAAVETGVVRGLGLPGWSRARAQKLKMACSSLLQHRAEAREAAERAEAVRARARAAAEAEGMAAEDPLARERRREAAEAEGMAAAEV